MPAKIPVLLLTTTLDCGGCEKMVYELACSLKESSFTPVVASLTGGEYFTEKLKEQGIAVYSCAMAHYGQALAAYRFLSRLIHTHNITIIHSFLFHAAMMARALKIRFPHLRTIAAIRTMEQGKQWHLAVDRLTKRFSDYEIANCQAVRDFIIEKTRSQPDRIATIYNGIHERPLISSEERLGIREQYGWGPHDRIIGTVGSLEPVKNHALLIEAMGYLTKEMDNIRCVIAGEGRLRNQLQGLAKAFDVEDAVSFLGFVDDPLTLISAFDLFVLPSLWEGFPNVILEAFSQKVPVLARRVGGVEEIIPPGMHAITDNDRAYEFSWDIKRLLDDRQLGECLAQTGYERVRGEFTIERMAQETIAVYEEVLG